MGRLFYSPKHLTYGKTLFTCVPVLQDGHQVLQRRCMASGENGKTSQTIKLKIK